MHFLRNHPATFLITAALTTATIASGQFGVGAISLIMISLGLLGISESLMGSTRVAITAITVSAIGISMGIVVQAVGFASDSYAVWNVDTQHFLDPLIGGFGAFMASTAYMRRVVRDRVRTIGFCLLIVFALYSGQPFDLYRLAAALTGLVGGIIFTHHKGHITTHETTPRPEGRLLLASLVTITAVGPVVGALAPVTLGLLAPLGSLFRDSTDPAGLAAFPADSQGAILVSLIPLLVQLVAAYGILKGRRLGLWVTIVINVMLTVFAATFYLPILFAEIFGGIVPVESSSNDLILPMLVSIAVPLGVAIVSIALLRTFPAPHNTRSTQFFARVAVAGLASSLCYVGTMASTGELRNSSLGDSFVGMLTRFVPDGFLAFETPSIAPSNALAHLVYDFTGTAFWVAVLTLACWQILRDRTHQAIESAADLRGLLRHGLGTGPLSWMTTWAGHDYWRDEGAVVAYRVVSGVAIVTGLPVCSPERISTVIRSFEIFARHHGWIPVFYGVPETNTAAFPADNWSALKIAEETILSVDNWALTGKSMQDTRSGITRAQKQGVFSRWVTYAELSEPDVAQINTISRQWADAKALPEMGFTLGSIREMHDPDVRLLIAQDNNGRIHAITSWLPTYRAGTVNTWTLDFMRRGPESMPGVIEFLISEMVSIARSTNAQQVSLSAAPLANTLGLERGIADRGTAFLSRMLEPVYGFQSLQHFKSKFRPAMNSMFLMYPDPVALPAIGIGLARAYLPDFKARHALAYLRTAR